MKMYAVISPEQDLDLESLEKSLKEISKAYRSIIYKKGEFLASNTEYGYYVFVQGNDEDEEYWDNLANEFREYEIVAYILNGKDYENYIKNSSPESCRVVCDGEVYKDIDYNEHEDSENEEETYDYCLILTDKLTNNVLEEINLFFDDNNFDNTTKKDIKNEIDNDGNFGIYWSNDLKELKEIQKTFSFDTKILSNNEEIDINNKYSLIIDETNINQDIVDEVNDFSIERSHKPDKTLKEINDEIKENGHYTIWWMDNKKKLQEYAKYFSFNTKIIETLQTESKTSSNNAIAQVTFDLERIKVFDDFFKDKIIGQNTVLETIKEQLILKAYEQDENDNRPLGIFLFLGPTGVGKTEVCKQLSEFLYNNKNINRFDMSEYSNETSIGKLIGADHGYVGFEEGGTLINALEANPNSIILFDEIEKSHKKTWDIFLQMFDEGIVTSNQGKRFSLKNNFIILTSNIGANKISFNDSYQKICEKIKQAALGFFNNEINRPEILGRIGYDNLFIFDTITDKSDQYKILDIYFKKFIQLYKSKNIEVILDNKIYDYILANVDITKGARDIRNNFDSFKKEFTKLLFTNNIEINNNFKTIKLEVKNNKLNIKNN